MLERAKLMTTFFHPTFFIKISKSQMSENYETLIKVANSKALTLFLMFDLNEITKTGFKGDELAFFKKFYYRQFVGFWLILSKSTIKRVLQLMESCEKLVEKLEVFSKYGKFPVIFDFPNERKFLPSINQFLAFYRQLPILNYKWLRPFFKRECWFPFSSLGRSSCNAGETTVAIDSHGYVYPCSVFFNQKNAHKVHIENLSSFEDVQKYLLRHRDLPIKSCCNSCEARSFCGRCPYPYPFTRDELCRLCRQIIWVT
jgi:radical SAM protein with 4Fe4S-binding SPASM domain